MKKPRIEHQRTGTECFASMQIGNRIAVDCNDDSFMI